MWDYLFNLNPNNLPSNKKFLQAQLATSLYRVVGGTSVHCKGAPIAVSHSSTPVLPAQLATPLHRVVGGTRPL